MNVADAGLARDTKDEKRAKHCRNELVGATYQHEYYQPMPFFFTREGNTVPIMGNYRGARCFLICGGPSFADVDHSLLDNCFTASLNNGVKSYRTDMWFSIDDPGRFVASVWLDPKIMKFVPYDHAEKELWDSRFVDGSQRWGPLGHKVGDCPNVYFYKRNEKFNEKRWLWESTFNWGNHSKWGGSRSVMLPALRILFVLGFRTVYLLGADFKMDKDTRYHFDEERKKGAINCNTNTYKTMNEVYFPKLRKEFEKYNFYVYNCNPKSNLTAFDYIDYDKAIKHATYCLGDLDKERTRGMYKTFGEKMKELKDSKEESQINGDNIKKELEEAKKKVEEFEEKLKIVNNA